MSDPTIQSGTFEDLLAEALRAGPGTPPWRDTLQQLGAQSSMPAEELQLLLRVREHLQSGKNYRSIRGTSALASRILSNLNQPAGLENSGSSFWWVAGLALLTLTLIISLAVFVFRNSEKSESPLPVGPLLETTLSDDFDGPLASEWRPIGQFKLQGGQPGLRPAAQAIASGIGGGIVWTQELPPEEPFSVSTTLNLSKGQDSVLAEIFITDQTAFDPATAISNHEFVWLMQGRSVSVLNARGEVQLQSHLPDEVHNPLQVRLTVNGDRITVDQQDRTVWSGSAGLNATRPKYIGLRFLKGGADASNELAFTRIRVNQRHGRAGI